MKNKILPIVAGVLVLIAILVIILIPKDNKTNTTNIAQSESVPKSTTQNNSKVAAPTPVKSSGKLATLDENGNVIINTNDLSENQISFFKYSDNSKIELIAIKGEDGNVRVSLGTCWSCNGSPYAYYTQSGELLQCNNCGLTFPLNVIGVDGTGCHPIMIDESGITKTDTGIVIDKDVLLKNEKLFSNIVAH